MLNNSPDTTSPLLQSADFVLSFRLRQPQPAKPKKCVVLLHGVGGDETNLADFAATMDADTLVVFPRGPLQLGARQYGWFQVSFTAEGPKIVEGEAEQCRQTLIRFLEQLQSAYGIAPAHIVIAGFSQGGIVSASVALSTPERVAAFAILSGRILPELAPHLAGKERLANLRGFIAHGEQDTRLPLMWGQRSDSLLNELGVPHLTRFYPMDHGICAAEQADFMGWLNGLD